eukprot:CAMPEP_0171187580 /NCGR_PEP_ID=MMETSP0790-20130122/17394_1 /TAXON_ID=2925 /ORGANISM="Alexandrium catenella, Strain OF101" /LENGTH=199 /DNA_ID=CAMNT_0011652645 /DNA_START=69 /DNA_END=665 /DNA_ORIENTATION=+
MMRCLVVEESATSDCGAAGVDAAVTPVGNDKIKAQADRDAAHRLANQRKRRREIADAATKEINIKKEEAKVNAETGRLDHLKNKTARKAVVDAKLAQKRKENTAKQLIQKVQLQKARAKQDAIRKHEDQIRAEERAKNAAEPKEEMLEKETLAQLATTKATREWQTQPLSGQVRGWTKAPVSATAVLYARLALSQACVR